MIAQKIYIIITKIYSLFFSSFENFFLKKKNKFIYKPLYRFPNKNSEKINYKNFQRINWNKYLSKIIFSEEDIFKLINIIFKKNNLANEITALTGFNYTISFFTAYETYKISDDEKNLQWYANEFHKDKPYSNNMLKVFLSFQEIGDRDGPMVIKDEILHKATLKSDEVILFFPTRYYHKATSPENGTRFQMMFQLNPSSGWKINKNIYFKQKKIEPKFPFFSYLFDKKLKIEIHQDEK